MKWIVKINSNAESELKKLLKKEIISKADIKILLRWIDEMEEYGPQFIQSSSEWHDHQLERNWSGYRSSAFSKNGRIIYKLLEEKIIVEVVRVTPNHDYKK